MEPVSKPPNIPTPPVQEPTTHGLGPQSVIAEQEHIMQQAGARQSIRHSEAGIAMRDAGAIAAPSAMRTPADTSFSPQYTMVSPTLSIFMSLQYIPVQLACHNSVVSRVALF